MQIDIFLFPLLATWLETKIYGVRPPDQPGWLKRVFGKGGDIGNDVPEGVAVRVTNLRKLYSTKALGFIGRNKPVTAIEDLSFGVPKASCPSASRNPKIVAVTDNFCRARSFACWDETVLPNLPLWVLSPNSSTLPVGRSAMPKIYISVSRLKKMFSGTN